MRGSDETGIDRAQPHSFLRAGFYCSTMTDVTELDVAFLARAASGETKKAGKADVYAKGVITLR